MLPGLAYWILGLHILRACFENISGGLAAGRGGWLRCASVADFSRICALVAPRHPPRRARNPGSGLFSKNALKRAARLNVPDRLRYLMMTRKVLGAMLLLNAAVALCTSFIAMRWIHPHLAVIIHLDSPGDGTARSCWLYCGLFLATGFMVSSQ